LGTQTIAASDVGPARPAWLSSSALRFCSENDLRIELKLRLSPTEQTLVYLVKPFGERRICPGTDWAALDSLARSLGLTERLGPEAEELVVAGVPPSWVERWADVRRARAARNLLLAREEADLLSAFQRNGIEAIPLKGVSLARILYGDVSRRPVTDIDLAIQPCEISRAASILESRGYTISLPHELLRDPTFLHSAGEHTAEVGCLREQAGSSLLVELHWKVLPLPDDLLWSSQAHYEAAGPAGLPLRTLTPELYLLFLCAHVSGHGWTSLRWICDVSDFLLRFAGRIDPAEFLRHCRTARLCHRTGTTLELIESYFGLRWEAVSALRNSSTRRTAAEFLLRPLTPALDISVGAIHRERLRLQDNPAEQLRYLWWLAHPTRLELLNGRGVLRSRTGAWLCRATRLARLAWNEAISRGQLAVRPRGSAQCKGGVG
jgi:hypothetical protein